MRGTRQVQHGALTVHDGLGNTGAARGAQDERGCIQRQWLADVPGRGAGSAWRDASGKIDPERHRPGRGDEVAARLRQYQSHAGGSGDGRVARLGKAGVEQHGNAPGGEAGIHRDHVSSPGRQQDGDVARRRLVQLDGVRKSQHPVHQLGERE